MCSSDYIDLFNARGPKEESPLNADAVRCGAPNGKVRIVTAFSQTNDGAPKFLDPFAIAFFDPQMHDYGVAWTQLRDVWICRCFESFHKISHVN
jgi:hypothetical protein